jgi:hypothetical protein
MEVDKLEEGINFFLKDHSEIHKSKINIIDKEFTNNNRGIKSQIRPDICYWRDDFDPENRVGEQVLSLFK